MIINNGDIFDIGQTINGVSNFIYLNEKIESKLGYRHVVTMEAGLIEIIKFLQRRGER